ncbi:DnaA N-terminal domain-containing protein [Psychrobacillus sp. L4]|uniref:DnaA N-terminal domain-containing protein n=1 Tax=Psychrobacillus sp. L4 TaxID=3236892 RepID=UPI0036F3C2AB
MQIESQEELLLHFKNMDPSNPVSTIKIPGVGTFKILLQKVDTPEMEKVLQDEKLDLMDGEEFLEWKKVLLILQRDIPLAAFETWLKRTWAVEINRQHICINCSNYFQLDWIKNHYLSKILSTVEEVTGKQYFLEFQVFQKE